MDELDTDQLAAVKLRVNGTVSAGAGSGKTTVLAARYLDLVLDSAADVRSILCLTFTRKAAAEMRARIWRELSKETSPRAKAEAARFSEASIATIDSFCGSILRSSAQRYGYAPDFRVDDDAARKIALDEALRFLLARREDPALRELFSYQGFMTAWRELFGEAGHRFSTPAPERGAAPAETPSRARAALLRIAGDAIGKIEGAADIARELGDLGTKAGADFIGLIGMVPGNLAEFLSSPGGIAETARRTEGLRGIALRFGKSDGSGRDRLKEAAESARDAARRLAACADAAGRRGLEDRIVGLLVEFADIVAGAKRAAGIMGFHDVVVATVDLLSTEPAIRTWWKKRFRWIMVDEFQDDDELQKDLFFLLAESPDRFAVGVPSATELSADKLFFVGDDKQSIYRFRGADVSVFNRLGRELVRARGDRSGAIGSVPPRLRTNYRSEPSLVAFFNGVFSRLLAGEGAADFEARFEETLARRATPGIEPSVTLLVKPKNDAAGAGELRSDDEALAEGLTRHLEELVASRRCLVPKEGGGTRPIDYDDIAVLLRSSSKQFLLERFFRLHDIPHRATSVRSLFVESPANDLLSLLRLALIPTDRSALATFLRSPFVRISDAGFVALLAEEKGLDAEAGALELSAKDADRVRSARELLKELGVRVDRMPLALLLSWLWHERGLRLSFLAEPSAHPFLEHFDWLFALAVQADRDGDSLAAFLERLGPLLGTPDAIDDGIEVPREAKGGIRIMTIHKSKGLEFPVVVIPWIENKGIGETKGPAWYESEEAGITLNLRDWRDPAAGNTNLFFEEAKAREESRALAETKRLFYVACTRASAHLILAGLLPGSLPSTSFFSFLGARVGADGALEGLPAVVRRIDLPDLAEETYRRLAGKRSGVAPDIFAEAYGRAEILDRSRPGRFVPATTVGLVAWENDPRRSSPPSSLPESAYDAVADRVPENRFGELCHAVLEARIGGRPLDPFHSAPAAIPEDLRAGLLAEADRLADGFFASPRSAILSGAREVLVEKPLLLALGGHIIRARLDLVVVGTDEIIVVDWKSGKEAISAAYAVQLALYRRALAFLYPDRRIRSLVWWLRSATEEEVAEEFDDDRLAAWIADAAAVTIGDRPGDASNRPFAEEISSARAFLADVP